MPEPFKIYQKTSYFSSTSAATRNGPREPLLLGCSGGGGHNTAAEGICKNFGAQKPQFSEEKKGDSRAFHFRKHAPVLYHTKKSTKTKKLINATIWASGTRVVGDVLSYGLSKSKYAEMPPETATEILEQAYKQTVGVNLVRLNFDPTQTLDRNDPKKDRKLRMEVMQGLQLWGQKPTCALYGDKFYYIDPANKFIFSKILQPDEMATIIDAKIFPPPQEIHYAKAKIKSASAAEFEKIKNILPASFPLAVPAKERDFMDMLIDNYEAGYESVAYWNTLQKMDKTADLTKLVNLQPGSDAENYATVKKKFFDTLMAADPPYTEIISTQAMALPALCDAVIEYNKAIEKHNKSYPAYRRPDVIIQQYMTDLPTKGAVHFAEPLSNLSQKQQSVMNLYGVGMNREFFDRFHAKNGVHFNAICDIDPKDNPMVRPAFANEVFNHSKKYRVADVTIELKGEEKLYAIEKDKKIASIMLGSQASNDTYRYIMPLLAQGIDQIFVFGGKNNPEILEFIEKLKAERAKEGDLSFADRIIPLGMQDDIHIAPLMTRSNVVVTRGGGLSVMEQLAMDHNPEQVVLIHHKDLPEGTPLTSGISWEDENVNTLIRKLRGVDVRAEKTCPDRVGHQLAAMTVDVKVEAEVESSPKAAATPPLTKHPTLGAHSMFAGNAAAQSSSSSSPPLKPGEKRVIAGDVVVEEDTPVVVHGGPKGSG